MVNELVERAQLGSEVEVNDVLVDLVPPVAILREPLVVSGRRKTLPCRPKPPLRWLPIVRVTPIGERLGHIRRSVLLGSAVFPALGDGP